jgi:hypothetical protein
LSATFGRPGWRFANFVRGPEDLVGGGGCAYVVLTVFIQGDDGGNGTINRVASRS